MPSPAFSTETKDSSAAETTDIDSSWYNAFGMASNPATAQPAGGSAAPAPIGATSPYADALDTLTLADIPGPLTRVAAADDAALPALVNRQRTELDRLTRDNERLMDRIETLLQIQEREQVLRQQLQNQLEHISERMKHSAVAGNLDAVRSEARAGVTEELKPVLMAILDALERFARRPAAHSAPPPDPTVEDAVDPYAFEDFGKLPVILTRPLDELMSEADQLGTDGGSPNRGFRSAPFHGKRRRGTHPRPQDPAGLPAAFAWTTVISS